MRKLFLFFSVLLFVFACSAQDYSIQQYLSIRSATSPSLSPDGKRLFYLTNVTGTSQIWMKDLPSGEPVQLTSYDDNISFVRYSPKGDALVFGKAVGGDENAQLFWMRSDGTGVKPLTNMPKVRHNFGGWSNDGTKIYYASNKRNPQFFDVYSMTVADGKETLLYQQDGNNSVAAVDPTGKRLIISRSGTELSLDNNLYLYDLTLRKETHLTPHTGAAQFNSPRFTADGFFFVQNDKREFSSLSQMRLKNANKSDWSAANRTVSVLDNSNWDVDSMLAHTYGDKIAYTLNRDGYSELFVRNFETNGKPLVTVAAKQSEKITITESGQAIGIPRRGVIGGLDLSANGKFLAFTFNNANSSSEIYIYDLEKKTNAKVTTSNNADIDPGTFVEPQLVKFKSFDGQMVPTWYYRPRPKGNSESGRLAKGRKMPPLAQISAQSQEALPVIVSVHGGPEGQERPVFNPLYQYYLSRGYAILATNVRGSTGYGKAYSHLDDVHKREDSVKDLASGVEWLKEFGNADPTKIAVMGGSYGGYMTLAAVTLYPDLWAAAVDTVGIVNWETFLKNTSGYRRRQREVEYGKLDKDLDFLRSISPIAKVDKIKAPLFVIHGKNDPRVPYTEAEQIVQAIKTRGGIVKYKLYDDEGHGISKLKNRLDLYPQVAEFLDTYVKR